MGAGGSSQRMGERVMGARKKLESDLQLQKARTEQIRAASRDTLDVMVQSIADAFERCAPFSEQTLLVAFEANREEVQRIVAKAVKNITNREGVQVVYDWVGRTTFVQSLDCLTRRGYMVSYGQASGSVPPIDPRSHSLILTRPGLSDYTATREELGKRAGMYWYGEVFSNKLGI